MAPQNVLVTGPYGEAGEAILDRLVGKKQYEFTFLNRSDHPEYETHVADIADYEAIRPAFDGQDAVIHLAAQSDAGADFEEVIDPNVIGTYNVLKAMEDADVPKLIFASSQRVMGLYEEDEVWDQSQTGSWERGSEEYQEMVKRLKASWTSQRDFAHLLECCLENETVTYDTFYAVSDNAARWFDTEHAKEVLGYEPQDDGSAWEQPPDVENTPSP